jgi:catechol 2,3-dioxygenase-like lactoylglutathione lyase family enzyme
MSAAPFAAVQPVVFHNVGDRPKAAAFFRDVLGFRLVSDDPFGAVFDMNGTPMRVTEIKGHTPTGHTVLGWNVPDIAAAIRTLTSRGVVMKVYAGFGQDALGIWTAPGGGAKVAWFTDPDGNVLSLTEMG